mmetsp:Transcript_4578/g.18303  ORF Transcript_4578/g.18303 Transcript_4578/m.18303 type:complete len:208 (+) Transcript_4578:631-1254(+)
MTSPRAPALERPVRSSAPGENAFVSVSRNVRNAAATAAACLSPSASSTTATPSAWSPRASSEAAARNRADANKDHAVTERSARVGASASASTSVSVSRAAALHGGSTTSHDSRPSCLSWPCAARTDWKGTRPRSAAATPRSKIALSAGGFAAAKPSSCPNAIARNCAPQNGRSSATGARSRSACSLSTTAGSERFSVSARISRRPIA